MPKRGDDEQQKRSEKLSVLQLSAPAPRQHDRSHRNHLLQLGGGVETPAES